MSIIEQISERTGIIEKDVEDMVNARKVANKIVDAREKAVKYHDTVETFFQPIRYQIDKALSWLLQMNFGRCRSIVAPVHPLIAISTKSNLFLLLVLISGGVVSRDTAPLFLSNGLSPKRRLHFAEGPSSFRRRAVFISPKKQRLIAETPSAYLCIESLV